MTDLKSPDARPIAKLISNAIKKGNIKGIADYILKNNLHKESKYDKEIEPSKEQIVDALCDIKVFATGAIRKAGYDPDIAMDEVIREIESRIGKVVDGKFIKDKSPEAMKNWYKADFNKALIKND